MDMADTIPICAVPAAPVIFVPRFFVRIAVVNVWEAIWYPAADEK